MSESIRIALAIQCAGIDGICAANATAPASALTKYKRARLNGRPWRCSLCANALRSVQVTHCPRGHEYTEANTALFAGKRGCKACRVPSQSPDAASLVLSDADIERFFDLTCPEPNTGCLMWTGPLDGHLYGQVTFPSTRYRLHRAHRVAWLIDYGSWPPRKACHKCDTPQCVNAAHLFDGSQGDNIRDAVRKGRLLPPPRLGGESHPLAKISAATVSEVRAAIADGKRGVDIAATFGISPHVVSSIKHRRSWA